MEEQNDVSTRPVGPPKPWRPAYQVVVLAVIAVAEIAIPALFFEARTTYHADLNDTDGCPDHAGLAVCHDPPGRRLSIAAPPTNESNGDADFLPVVAGDQLSETPTVGTSDSDQQYPQPQPTNIFDSSSKLGPEAEAE